MPSRFPDACPQRRIVLDEAGRLGDSSHAGPAGGKGSHSPPAAGFVWRAPPSQTRQPAPGGAQAGGPTRGAWSRQPPGGVLGQRPCGWCQGRPRAPGSPAGGVPQSSTQAPSTPLVARPPGELCGGSTRRTCPPLPSPPLPAPAGAHCSLVPCQPGASRCPLAPVGAAGTFSQVTCAVVLPSLPTNSDVPASPWQREVAWDAHTMSRGAAGRHRAGHSQEPPGDSGLCRVLPDATGSRARDTGTGEGCHDLLPSARARLQVGGRRQLASPLGGCFQPSPYGQTPAVPPGSGEGSPR